MSKVEFIGVMNDAKWDELRLAMYGLDSLSPKWRARDKETRHVSEWDGEWYYHLRNGGGGYSTIEWVEIQIENSAQHEAVLECLRRIHVPGERTEGGFRIFGWIPTGSQVDFIS